MPVALAVGALLALARRGGLSELRAGSSLASNSTDGPLFPRPPADRPRSGTAGAVGASTTIEVPMSAFLAFPAVVDWLKHHGSGVEGGGVDPNATVEAQGALLDYLPARVTLELSPALTAGSLGDAAAGGYVAFNLFNSKFASWLVVMDLRGSLLQVLPVDDTGTEGSFAHACGLKNYDEASLLLATSINNTAAGHVWRLDWRTGGATRLGADGALYGCHDVQWSARGGDAFWTPVSAYPACGAQNEGVALYDAGTGATRRTVETGYEHCAADVNHAQLLADDTRALLSLRELDGVALYELDESAPAGRRAWTIGGPYGEWPVVDAARNVTHPPGATVWKGQHNAEWMGEGEVWMYDNQGLGNNSRLLIVAVNESSRVATIAWEHDLGVSTTIYGDCDPTPAGGVLGSYWSRRTSNATADDEADAGVLEVSRATGEVAWHMRIYGKACPTDDCGDVWNGDSRSKDSSWTMYSVERFYDAPLLPSPSLDGTNGTNAAPECVLARDGGGDAAEVRFTVFDSYKSSSRKGGTFTLGEVSTGRSVASGTFTFNPHWRPTVVSAPVDVRRRSEPLELELVVNNSRGRGVSRAFNCTW